MSYHVLAILIILLRLSTVKAKSDHHPLGYKHRDGVIKVRRGLRVQHRVFQLSMHIVCYAIVVTVDFQASFENLFVRYIVLATLLSVVY